MDNAITLYITRIENDLLSITEDMPSIRHNCNAIGTNILPALAEVMSKDNNNVMIAFPAGKYVCHLQAYLDSDGYNMYFYDFKNDDKLFYNFIKKLEGQPENTIKGLIDTYNLLKSQYEDCKDDFELVIGTP